MGNKQITDLNITKIRDNLYNAVIPKALKGCENSNIQYIIEVAGDYRVASLKPLTTEEIENINFKQWNFKPFKEWEEIWKKNKLKNYWKH